MQAINPEMRDLQQQVTELRDRLAKAEGEIQQLNRTGSDNVKQTIWQFVIFTLSMGGLLIGGLNYQTTQLDARANLRSEAIEQRINSLEKRLEQTERNINARFEDLKQEVRSRK
jgi:chaperonin cofactor prefoldin